MERRKVYLGDGAYAEEGSYRGQIVVTTENGISVQNRVVLGPEGMASLRDFDDALQRSYAEADSDD